MHTRLSIVELIIFTEFLISHIYILRKFHENNPNYSIQRICNLFIEDKFIELLPYNRHSCVEPHCASLGPHTPGQLKSNLNQSTSNDQTLSA